MKKIFKKKSEKIYKVGNDLFKMKKQVLVVLLGLFLIGMMGMVAATCVDSDNGINKYVKGKVSASQNSEEDQCLGENLLEYYCENDSILKQSIKCNCNDGVCYDSSTCYDSENPNPVSNSYGNQWYQDKYVKGKVTLKSVNPNGVKEYIYEDECKNENGKSVLVDYTCSPLDESGGNFSVGFGNYIECPNGCKDGACLKESCPKVCKSIGTRSEGWYNSCTGELIEYANCGTTTTQCNVDSDCPQPNCASGTNCVGVSYKCENGKCVPETTTTPGDMNTCLDNSNNYWDQETDKCYSGYNKDIIKQLCKESDGGKNIYQYAHTFGFRSYSSANDPSRDLRIRTGGADGCISDKQLIENYCDEKGYIQTAYIDCANGCKDNACIKGEEISEKITCKFEDSKKEQKCYLAGSFNDADVGTKFCKADVSSGVCVISYTSYKDEKVTWKSSCGSYQYTTQDGNDETISFKCAEGETTTTQIQNKGFKYSYWQCYDGFENKAGDGNSCYASDNFNMKAKDDCEGHCSSESGKCGVNSFGVSGECYTAESETIPDCSLLDCVNPYYDREKKQCECGSTNSTTTDTEIFSNDVLICKDSCALDGKCYPFGYIKNGKFCNDDSSFTLQLKAESSCENNFECDSNLCIGNQCVSAGLWQKIMNWFKNLFG